MRKALPTDAALIRTLHRNVENSLYGYLLYFDRMNEAHRSRFVYQGRIIHVDAKSIHA